MIDFVTEANSFFKTSLSKRSLLDECYRRQKKLLKQWLDSGRTDFSVYDTEDYTWDCVLSYFCVSNRCLTNGERFFRYFDIPKGKALDVFNGIGLSTIHANLAGFKCDAVSANAMQQDFAQHSAKRILGKQLRIFSSLQDIRSASYDVVMSFEVLEHFKDPTEHVAELLRILKPGGYLIESTGFQHADHIGHFDTYTINGKQFSNREAATQTRKALEQHCTKLMVGYDKKPRIWVKALVPKPKSFFRGIHEEMLSKGLSPHYRNDWSRK